MVPTPATWLPEDDILLKSAIEDGASLEALAKGAVPFSRTFTLQEVHDRWHDMLYNPVISSQVSGNLLPDESDKRKEINASHRKRKAGTIRKRYHEYVKRRRTEFFSSADLGFLHEPNLHEQGTLHGGPQVGNTVLGDCMPNPFGLQVTNFDMPHQAFPQDLTNLAANYDVSNAGDAFHSEGPDPLVNNHMTVKSNCLPRFPVVDSPFPVQGSLRIDGMPHSLPGTSSDSGKGLLPGGEPSSTNVYTMEFSSPLPSMPLWKTMEDLDMPINVVSEDKTENVQNGSELSRNDGSKSKRVEKKIGDSFIHSASLSDDGFGDLPEALFEFSNDDLVLKDANRKELVDKSCCSNTLSNVPMDMDAIDTQKVGDNTKFVASAVTATEPEDGSSNSRTISGEEKLNSQVKVEMPSSPMLNSMPLEEGMEYCALNTEDPDIPCNDDIFLLIHPDSSNPASAKSAKDPISTKEINNAQGLNSVMKREELGQSSKSLMMFGSYMLPEGGQVHTSGGPSFRAELIDSYEDLAPRYKAVADPTQSKSVQTSLASAFEGNMAIEAPILRDLTKQNEGGIDAAVQEVEGNSIRSDQEGSESENDDLHFSDVETMILDMDLASYDDDLHFTCKASKYQQEDSKRRIIRMEQCARASLQRSMTTQGALAILYGRRSKHFIRKPEVILGRSTEETVVDIDLGKEGHNNKISRRQAILKMETDGSFTLRNLAKNPMFVNGAEVGSGESTVLCSSCLIEIRGINFAFDTNQKYVNSFRRNITKRGQLANLELAPKQERA